MTDIEPKRFRTIEIDGHIFYASVPAFEFEQTDTGWIVTAKSRIYHREPVVKVHEVDEFYKDEDTPNDKPLP